MASNDDAEAMVRNQPSIDDPLKTLAIQSLERLKDGEGDADLERRNMIAARIAEAKKVMPGTVNEVPAKMPFRSKQQQALMRTRSQLEAALREATAKNGLAMLQLTCMHSRVQKHIRSKTRLPRTGRVSGAGLA